MWSVLVGCLLVSCALGVSGTTCEYAIPEWGSCFDTPLCCEAGLTCYARDWYYAQCRSWCETSPEWSCRALSKSNTYTPPPPGTPSPTTEAPPATTSPPVTSPPVTSPPVTSSPVTSSPDQPASPSPATTSPRPVPPGECDELIPEGGSCFDTPLCCEAGTTCYERDWHFGQCLTTCEVSKGLTCRKMTEEGLSTPPPESSGLCAQHIPEGGTCTAAPHCCEVGTECYEKDGMHGQCLSSCPDGWSCRKLSSFHPAAEFQRLAGWEAPPCECPHVETGCTNGTGVCSTVPEGGACHPETHKCFASAVPTSRMMGLVFTGGASHFTLNAFYESVAPHLVNTSAEVLVRYVCPASVCPMGRCRDPFGEASKCLTLYDLASRRVAVFDNEDGVVVGFSVEGGETDRARERLFKDFRSHSVTNAVALFERWEEVGMVLAPAPTEHVTTPEPAEEEGPGGFLIALAVGGAVIVVAAVVGAFFVCRRPEGKTSQDNFSEMTDATTPHSQDKPLDV